MQMLCLAHLADSQSITYCWRFRYLLLSPCQSGSVNSCLLVFPENNHVYVGAKEEIGVVGISQNGQCKPKAEFECEMGLQQPVLQSWVLPVNQEREMFAE